MVPSANGKGKEAMTGVFICPVDDESAAFGPALEIGCALGTVLPFINDAGEAEVMKNLYPGGHCHVWGVRDEGENRPVWEGMAAGDLLLGYRNGAILTASTVLYRTRNPVLADRLWGGTPERPFELMGFTGRPHVGEVPIVSQMLGYLDPDYRGFTRLGPEKCRAIHNAFGSLEMFVRLGLRYDFPFNFRHSE